jgi:hypothetical protein
MDLRLKAMSGRKQTGSFAMPINLKQTSCHSNANASHRPTQAFPSHLDGESRFGGPSRQSR